MLPAGAWVRLVEALSYEGGSAPEVLRREAGGRGPGGARTTQIYTHVTAGDLAEITSPLDELEGVDEGE